MLLKLLIIDIESQISELFIGDIYKKLKMELKNDFCIKRIKNVENVCIRNKNKNKLELEQVENR